MCCQNMNTIWESDYRFQHGIQSQPGIKTISNYLVENTALAISTHLFWIKCVEIKLRDDITGLNPYLCRCTHTCVIAMPTNGAKNKDMLLLPTQVLGSVCLLIFSVNIKLHLHALHQSISVIQNPHSLKRILVLPLKWFF